MKYDVHVFTVVRVKVLGVEADSQLEAIDKAERVPGYNEMFDCAYGDKYESEWSEEHSHFLVDEVEDINYGNSIWYGPNKEAHHPSLMGLVEDVMKAPDEKLPTYLGINETVDKIISLRLRKE